MTHAGCGLFASVCLTGIGILPRYAPVMVAHIHDMAAARPLPTTRLTALSPRADRIHTGAGRTRGRNSYGGKVPTQTPPQCRLGWGGLLGQAILGSSRGSQMTQASRPTVHPLRGLRLHHFGLKLDRSPSL